MTSAISGSVSPLFLAARTCKAERGTTEERRAAFKAKWGGNANAFGKCVSATARAADEDEEEPEEG